MFSKKLTQVVVYILKKFTNVVELGILINKIMLFAVAICQLFYANHKNSNNFTFVFF